MRERLKLKALLAIHWPGNDSVPGFFFSDKSDTGPASFVFEKRFTLTGLFFVPQAAGMADRIAQRNFADAERGLLLCSSGVGRNGSDATLE